MRFSSAYAWVAYVACVACQLSGPCYIVQFWFALPFYKNCLVSILRGKMVVIYWNVLWFGHQRRYMVFSCWLACCHTCRESHQIVYFAMLQLQYCIVAFCEHCTNFTSRHEDKKTKSLNKSTVASENLPHLRSGPFLASLTNCFFPRKERRRVVRMCIVPGSFLFR